MKAICTRYRGPTDTRGSRITATAEGVKSHTVSYDHALDADENHLAAARGLALRMDWIKATDAGDMAFGTRYVGGTLPDGTTRVFVARY